LNVPPRRINEIVWKSAASRRTPPCGWRASFDTSAELWTGLQADYDLRLARQAKARVIERDVKRRHFATGNGLERAFKKNLRAARQKNPIGWLNSVCRTRGKFQFALCPAARSNRWRATFTAFLCRMSIAGFRLFDIGISSSLVRRENNWTSTTVKQNEKADVPG